MIAMRAKRKMTKRRAKPNPTLRFTPTAWAKLLFLRDYGQTEVGGFGIASDDDPLLVGDVALVEQVCSWTHVEFDDESVADFFDRQVDAGRRPEQFARIWIHTHPGDCPEPSLTDEETFARVFGGSDWAVMFILAAEGEAYARLRFNVGPGGEREIPVEVDYSREFGGSDREKWEQEYFNNVQAVQSVPVALRTLPEAMTPFQEQFEDDWYGDWFEYTQDDDIITKGFGE